MLFNILGLFAGPLMISTGIGLLVLIGWIWAILSVIGVVWFLIAFISSLF